MITIVKGKITPSDVAEMKARLSGVEGMRWSVSHRRAVVRRTGATVALADNETHATLIANAPRDLSLLIEELERVWAVEAELRAVLEQRQIDGGAS